MTNDEILRIYCGSCKTRPHIGTSVITLEDRDHDSQVPRKMSLVLLMIKIL